MITPAANSAMFLAFKALIDHATDVADRFGLDCHVAPDGGACSVATAGRDDATTPPYLSDAAAAADAMLTLVILADEVAASMRDALAEADSAAEFSSALDAVLDSLRAGGDARVAHLLVRGDDTGIVERFDSMRRQSSTTPDTCH